MTKPKPYIKPDCLNEGAEPICIAEYVGRHNALDEVIGYVLINEIDFSNTFAASTGKMVSDMVSKIC